MLEAERRDGTEFTPLAGGVAAFAGLLRARLVNARRVEAGQAAMLVQKRQVLADGPLHVLIRHAGRLLLAPQHFKLFLKGHLVAGVLQHRLYDQGTRLFRGRLGGLRGLGQDGLLGSRRGQPCHGRGGCRQLRWRRQVAGPGGALHAVALREVQLRRQVGGIGSRRYSRAALAGPDVLGRAVVARYDPRFSGPLLAHRLGEVDDQTALPRRQGCGFGRFFRDQIFRRCLSKIRCGGRRQLHKADGNGSRRRFLRWHETPQQRQVGVDDHGQEQEYEES